MLFKKPFRLLALSAGLLCAAMLSHADVIHQESFSEGLGSFTGVGNISLNADYGVRMYGSSGTLDGAITSPVINTTNFNAIRVSYTRAVMGMDANESGVIEYSVDNGATYTAIANITMSGEVSYALPEATAGKPGLRLRFRVNANSPASYLTVDSFTVEGTPNGTPPDPGAGSCDNNPLCRGPNPTVAGLERTGPFQVANYRVPSPSGYGGGTIYYPTNPGGRVGAVVVIPGLNAAESSIRAWGPFLASHGFVTITIGTNSLGDGIPQRAAQQLAALRQVVALSNATGNPISGRVDGTRLGVMGWSLGAGASLVNARANPANLKASIPLAPTSVTGMSAARVPVMIFACQRDAVLPIGRNAIPSYNGMTSNQKVYLEVTGGGHGCANTPTAASNALGKYGVAWMKRWLDNDTRYNAILCGPAHEADLRTETGISSYRSNCQATPDPDPTPTPNPTPGVPVVSPGEWAIVGSSTAAGTGSTGGRSWPALLRGDVSDEGVTIDNRAVSGTTTRSANVAAALSSNTKLLIIAYPTNDAANGIPVSETVRNVLAMRTYAQGRGVAVIVQGTQPRNFSDTAQDRLEETDRQLAAAVGACFVDVRSALAASNGNIRSEYNSGDGIHPNNAGHAVIFRRYQEVINSGRCVRMAP